MTTAQTATDSDILENLPAVDKTAIGEYVRRWGGSSSIILFDPSCKFFSCPGIEGIIGYRTESKCAIAFGDPLCHPLDIPQLVQAFHRYCQEKKWRIVYVTASAKFSRWAIKNVCGSLIEIGEELAMDPYKISNTGTRNRAIRNKINNAKRANVAVREYLTSDPALEKKIEEVGQSWLRGRSGPQIYLSQVQLFAERKGKRWFYAHQGERLVGVILLHQIEARKGWLLEFLMTTPDAPLGTSEQLILSVLKSLQTENCRYLTFGVVQGEELGEIIGLKTFSAWLARMIFKSAKRIFSLHGRRRFWRKFHPETEPSYLLFSEPKITLRDARSVLRALNVNL